MASCLNYYILNCFPNLKLISFQFIQSTTSRFIMLKLWHWSTFQLESSETSEYSGMLALEPNKMGCFSTCIFVLCSDFRKWITWPFGLQSPFDHRENKTIIKWQHVKYVGWWASLMTAIRNVVERGGGGGTGLPPVRKPGQEQSHECFWKGEIANLSDHVYDLKRS